MLRRGGKVETLSRPSVKFLTAICEVCSGVNGLRFLQEMLPSCGLARDNGRWPFVRKAQRMSVNAFPRAVGMGKVHRRIQAACNDFRDSKIERDFLQKFHKIILILPIFRSIKNITSFLSCRFFLYEVL